MRSDKRSEYLVMIISTTDSKSNYILETTRDLSGVRKSKDRERIRQGYRFNQRYRTKEEGQEFSNGVYV